MLYFSQFYSHLSCAINVWGPMSNQDSIRKLQRIQDDCIDAIISTNIITDIDRDKLKILKVKDVIKLENCKLAYKANRDQLPIKINDCIKTDNLGRNLEKKT